MAISSVVAVSKAKIPSANAAAMAGSSGEPPKAAAGALRSASLAPPLTVMPRAPPRHRAPGLRHIRSANIAYVWLLSHPAPHTVQPRTQVGARMNESTQGHETAGGRIPQAWFNRSNAEQASRGQALYKRRYGLGRSGGTIEERHDDHEPSLVCQQGRLVRGRAHPGDGRAGVAGRRA